MNDRGELIILHISDLHRAPEEPLSNVDLWASLRHDIWTGYSGTNRNLRRDEPLLPRPNEIDLVVISGDLTQSAARAEYEEVEAFVETIADELLDGERSRIIIAPGNHDIDWDLCRAAYREVRSPTPDQLMAASLQEGTYRLAERDGPLNRVLMQRAREDLHAARLTEFARFIERFYGGAFAFPVDDRSSQYLLFEGFAEQLCAVVVAFNSCDNSDHLWHRGSIHREAILNASQELDLRHDPVYGPLRIAVWHHNVLGSPHQADFLDPAAPLLLGEYGFTLGLHGHVHETGRLELLGSHARIPIVWAGSLAVGGSDRPPSIPLLYNVIGIDVQRREGWVHVRARKNEWETWSAFHDWSPVHRCWYPLHLPARVGDNDTGHRVYRNAYDTQLGEELESLLLHAKDVTVIAAAGLIVQGNFRDILVRRAASGDLKATLCYGNPFSPHVRDRLVEEEYGLTRPDIAAAGIVRRVTSILEATEGVENIRVRLFNNYPTMCIIRIDNRYMHYPLGYRTLGSECPAVVEDASSTFGRFLQSMERLYLQDSIDAAEMFRTRVFGHHDRGFLVPENVREVAVFALPDASSPFYRAGAELLGYDPLGTPELEVPPDMDAAYFRSHAGRSKMLGFHLPITEVMYLDANQISSLIYEVREIASSIEPLQLSIDEISYGESWPNEFALICSDASGGLERLHAEVTVRVRPAALGTDFTLDTRILKRLPRVDQRDRLMLEAYQSPNVLSKFRPHFSLASPERDLSAQDQARLREIIASRFRDYLGTEARVVVDHLYILERTVGAQQWDAVTESRRIRFGGQAVRF